MKRIKLLFFISVVVLLCACQRGNKIALSESTLDKISELEDKYGITINYCNVPVEEDVNLEYEIATNADEITEAVEAAEIIFSRLPEGWAEDLMNPETYIGLYTEITKVNVVFCEELENDSDAYGSEISLGGQFVGEDETLYLMADIHNFEAKISIADSIINRMLNIAIYDDECRDILLGNEPGREEEIAQSLFNDYEKCNPENFKYYGYITEIKDEDRKYIYSDTLDIEDVYFINEESLYSEYFDCRNIIGPLLYTDEDEKLPEAFNSPHIQGKIEYTFYWIDYIFFYQEVYWHRWFG